MYVLSLLTIENANDSLKGRVMEFSLGDLNKEEDQAFRKIKLRVEDIKVRSSRQSRYRLHAYKDVAMSGKELFDFFLRNGLHH
jgi:ribosomal protein S3AE